MLFHPKLSTLLLEIIRNGYFYTLYLRWFRQECNRFSISSCWDAVLRKRARRCQKNAFRRQMFYTVAAENWKAFLCCSSWEKWAFDFQFRDQPLPFLGQNDRKTSNQKHSNKTKTHLKAGVLFDERCMRICKMEWSIMTMAAAAARAAASATAQIKDQFLFVKKMHKFHAWLSSS